MQEQAEDLDGGQEPSLYSRKSKLSARAPGHEPRSPATQMDSGNPPEKGHDCRTYIQAKPEGEMANRCVRRAGLFRNHQNSVIFFRCSRK